MSYEIGKAPEIRTVNGFFCMGCNSLLISMFTHDYKVCDCGNMVDGGSSYVRRGYKTFEAYQNVVEIFDWTGILVAAEIGFTEVLTDRCGPRNPLIKQLIKQERLIFTQDAEEPKDGKKELGLTVMADRHEGDDGFTTEELVRTNAEKEAKDRARADELAAEVLSISTRTETD